VSREPEASAQTAPENAAADQGVMGIIDHLRELRNAIGFSVIAIAVCSGVMLYFADEIFRVLMLPIMEIYERLGQEQRLVFTSPPEGFVTYIKVGLFAGFLTATPFWMYFLGRFVWLGLRMVEKQFLLAFVGAGSFLFVIGGAFGYFKIFPLGLSFLIENYQGESLKALITIREYFSFSTKLIIAFGTAFQLPLVMFFLGRIGLATWRGLLRGFRYAVVAIFIVAAILTPPDVATQIGLAIPLCFLYMTGVLLVALFGKRRPAAESTTAE